MKGKKGQAIIESTILMVLIFFMFMLGVKGFYYMYNEISKKARETVRTSHKVAVLYVEMKKMLKHCKTCKYESKGKHSKKEGKHGH